MAGGECIENCAAEEPDKNNTENFSTAPAPAAHAADEDKKQNAQPWQQHDTTQSGHGGALMLAFAKGHCLPGPCQRISIERQHRYATGVHFKENCLILGCH